MLRTDDEKKSSSFSKHQQQLLPKNVTNVTAAAHTRSIWNKEVSLFLRAGRSEGTKTIISSILHTGGGLHEYAALKEEEREEVHIALQMLAAQMLDRDVPSVGQTHAITHLARHLTLFGDSSDSRRQVVDFVAAKKDLVRTADIVARWETDKK